MTTPIINPDSANLKRCTKCGELKPHEAFNRSKTNRDGLASHCRACQSVYKSRWQELNRDKAREASRRYRSKHPDKIKESARHYRKTNQDVEKARRRRHYEANADFAREYARRYREANHDEVLAYMRRYREENRDSLREYDRRQRETHLEYHREKARKWAKLNPEKRRAIRSRREARKRNLPSVFTNTDWHVAVDHFGGCCAVCGRPIGLWHTLAADHWIPLSSPNCPGTVAWNIVPLCHGDGGCNNSKLNRPAAEWLIGKFGKKKGNAILRRIESYLESRKPALAEGD